VVRVPSERRDDLAVLDGLRGAELVQRLQVLGHFGQERAR
jgi:hypothetical protein